MNPENTGSATPADAGTTAEPNAATTQVTTATTAPGESVADSGQSGVAAAPESGATTAQATATAEGAKDAAPEKYDLKQPEGSLLSAEAVQEVEALAREAGLSNEHAQKLLDAREAAVSGHLAKLGEEHAARIETWNTELKADPEVGGAKFEASLRGAEKVLAKFGDEQLRKDLEASGYGSHPGLFKMLARVSAAISEDVFEPAGNAGQNAKSGGAGWYTHPTSQHAA